VDGNSGDAVVSTPQSRNRLENGRGENDEVSERMQKAVEVSTREVRIKETERRRSKERSRKKTRRERKEEAEERKNSRG